MNKIDNLANRIVSGFNDCFTYISSFKFADFNSSHKICIALSKVVPFPYISKDHSVVYSSVVDFVSSLFPPFCRSHLVFRGSDDNKTFWEVV